MKRTILAITLALAAMTTAQAQSTATSTTQSAANSAAQNAGNAQNINFNSDASGTLKNTPSLAMGGFSGSFSSDYCAGTAQGGGGAPGAIISFGGPVKDKTCALYRGVERTMQVSAALRAFNPTTSAKLDQAAINMLCSAEEIGPAMRESGLCTITVADTTPRSAQANSIYSGGQ